MLKFVERETFVPVVFSVALVLIPTTLRAATCEGPYCYDGVAYQTLGEAEFAMRHPVDSNGNPKDGNWYYFMEFESQEGNRLMYSLPDKPHLPNPAWRASMPDGEYVWGFRGYASPHFHTWAEGEAWAREVANVPTAWPPHDIVSDDLIFRGSYLDNSGDTVRAYTHNYTPVAVTTVDFTAHNMAHFYQDFNGTPGVEEAKVSKSFHTIYRRVATQEPQVLHVSGTIQEHNGVDYVTNALPVIEVEEVSVSVCQTPYSSDGTQCVSDKKAYIFIGSQNQLDGDDHQKCPPVPNDSNPCNPANGNKFQVEVDYESPAEGGLRFVRYYNSHGAYKTGENMAPGWRHNYSRSVDERPDRRPTLATAPPPTQSISYSTVAEACTSGWADIKTIAYGGDLSAATATFAGGNICEIHSGGSTVAYLPVRSSSGWAAYSGPTDIKTVVTSIGAAHRFELNSGNWENELNPGLTFDQSGSNWIYVDANDVTETFDSAGRLISIARRNGQTETLEHDLTTAQGGDDDNNTLDRVTGPFGHTLTFSYDTDGLLEKVTTPDGVIEYTYDSGDLDSEYTLDKVDYPDGSRRQYRYEDPDWPHHLTSLYDGNNKRHAEWEYDAEGRAISSKKMYGYSGEKESVEFTYNTDGSTTLTMGNGAVRHYDYATVQGTRKQSLLSGDVCGTCPGGNIANRSYDANGYLYEAEDWNGNTTRTIRNSRGLTETFIEAAGTTDERTTSVSWHASHRLPLQVVSPRNTTTYTYDADGNVLSVSVSGGGLTRAWAFTYNSNGQPLTIDGPRTDASDVTTLEYYTCSTGSECGQLKKITNALGHSTTFDTYDAAGRLLQATDANGLQTAFTYDWFGRVLTTTLTPPVGVPRVTTMTYDGEGQLLTLTTPDNVTLTYEYSKSHYVENVTDDLGNYIDYVYDAMGNLISEDVYDPTDTLRRSVDYSYDINQHIDTVTRGGILTDITTDLVGNMLDDTDGNNNLTQYTYDALNRLDTTIDALLGVSDLDYDDHDNLTQVVAANGGTTDYVYDVLDNLVSETSPDRGLTTYTHDDAGNVLTATDARGITATYAYDALNRLTSVSYPDTAENIAYSYDDPTVNGIGRLTTLTDQGGTTSYTYDAFGSVLTEGRQILGNTYTVSYSYDAAGAIESITYPSGRVVNYTRDATGQLTSASSDFSGTVKSIVDNMAYEPFGPVSSITYGNGVVIDYEYGLDGDVDAITSNVAGGKNYMYDNAGNILALNNAGGAGQTQNFTYDDLNRIETEDSEIESTEYADRILADNPLAYWRLGETTGTTAYDASGNDYDGAYQGSPILGEAAPNGDVNSAMRSDQDNNDWVWGPTLNGITVTGLEAWFIADTSGNSHDLITLHNSDTDKVLVYLHKSGTVRVYDGVQGAVMISDNTVTIGQPHHVAVWYESTSNTTYFSIDGVVQQDTYTGNVLAVTDPEVYLAAYRRLSVIWYKRLKGVIDEVALYDGALTAANFANRTNPLSPGPSFDLTYQYDANSNRTSSDDGSTVTTLGYTALSNRLTSIGGIIVQRDLAGNRIADPGGLRTYSYDDTGRLDEVFDSGVPVASYVHNAHGQRVAKTVGTDTTVYVYDLNGRLIAEHDASGTLIRDYVRLGATPIAQIDQGEVFSYLHFDHLGTPRSATDDAQTVVWLWYSDAFGYGAASEDPDGDSTATTVNLRFPGQYYDNETNLHYNYFRTYDPSAGRYLESDPIGLLGGLNTFGYVDANPLSSIDPSGLRGIIVRPPIQNSPTLNQRERVPDRYRRDFHNRRALEEALIARQTLARRQQEVMRKRALDALRMARAWRQDTKEALESLDDAIENLKDIREMIEDIVNNKNDPHQVMFDDPELWAEAGCFNPVDTNGAELWPSPRRGNSRLWE